MWHMYKYVLKHPSIRQYIFKQTYRNVVFRDYILTLALYTVHVREFKHRWYQIYKAGYFFKHFKIVLYVFTYV